MAYKVPEYQINDKNEMEFASFLNIFSQEAQLTKKINEILNPSSNKSQYIAIGSKFFNSNVGIVDGNEANKIAQMRDWNSKIRTTETNNLDNNISNTTNSIISNTTNSIISSTTNSSISSTTISSNQSQQKLNVEELKKLILSNLQNSKWSELTLSIDYLAVNFDIPQGLFLIVHNIFFNLIFIFVCFRCN